MHDQSTVMLSKVSIRDHPHREAIIDLAKEIHVGEPKHLRKGKNARDYLLQAKTMFEASQPVPQPLAGPSRPQPKSTPFGRQQPKVSFTQAVTKGKQHGAAVFPAKLLPMNIPVALKPKMDWQTVQCKKLIDKGPKPQWFLESSRLCIKFLGSSYLWLMTTKSPTISMEYSRLCQALMRYWLTTPLKRHTGHSTVIFYTPLLLARSMTIYG